ncbi:MAG: oligosaccharide flippase family protein [Patescibacteria group bacterium]|jgi:O-antigen/teichoic acid export membrane protein
MNEAKKLLKSSSIVFIGTLIASLFSYLFNMMMGRLLGPTEYGEMTALMSLQTIIAVASGAILTISMRYSGELFNERYFDALKKLFLFLTKYLLLIGVGIFLVCLLFLKPIANFFSINSLMPISIVLSGVIFSLLIVINKGYFQGLQKFRSLASINILEMALRLGLGLALVMAGLKLNGAVSAIVLATIIAYSISFLPIKRMFNKIKFHDGHSFKFDKKEIISYTWPTLIASLFLVASLNIDIILVKHYFDPQSAGLYAAISTVAKIILYVTAPIASVMFPMVSERKVKGDKHYQIFLFSIIITLIGAFAVLAIYMIMPGKVVSILYGPDYVSAYTLLPEVGLFVLFYSMVNLMANYYMVIKNFFFLILYFIVLVAQIVMVSYWHPSILAVIRTFILMNGVLFALLMGYYVYTKKEALLAIFKSENES